MGQTFSLGEVLLIVLKHFGVHDAKVSCSDVCDVHTYCAISLRGWRGKKPCPGVVKKIR